MFFFVFFVPWQETLADARDWDGGGGGEVKPFRTILRHFSNLSFTISENKKEERKKEKTNIYILSMFMYTFNLIETPNTSIHNPKHSQNTNTYLCFEHFQHFQKPIYFKK